MVSATINIIAVVWSWEIPNIHKSGHILKIDSESRFFANILQWWNSNKYTNFAYVWSRIVISCSLERSGTSVKIAKSWLLNTRAEIFPDLHEDLLVTIKNSTTVTTLTRFLNDECKLFRTTLGQLQGGHLWPEDVNDIYTKSRMQIIWKKLQLFIDIGQCL